MQTSENRQTRGLPYPQGSPPHFRGALVYFSLVICGVIKAWHLTETPYPATEKFRGLLKEFSDPIIKHAGEECGENREAVQRELIRLLELFELVFERTDHEAGQPPVEPGHA